MEKPMNEKQVLKKLKIKDFRNLTKDHVVQMANLLEKMDPEVAKKALEQFPDFANVMKSTFTDYSNCLKTALENNGKSVQSVYSTCDAIISACQQELKNEKLSFDDKKVLLEQMKEIACLKKEIDKDNKNFLLKIGGMGLTALSLIAGSAVAVLGGNVKINFKK